MIRSTVYDTTNQPIDNPMMPLGIRLVGVEPPLVIGSPEWMERMNRSWEPPLPTASAPPPCPGLSGLPDFEYLTDPKTRPKHRSEREQIGRELMRLLSKRIRSLRPIRRRRTDLEVAE